MARLQPLNFRTTVFFFCPQAGDKNIRFAALVDLAQIRPRKRVTIFGIHDQKGGRTLVWRTNCQAEKGSSRRVEPLFRLPAPLSLAPRVLRLFQLTPSHTEEALALVAQALTTVVSIAVASTVVQRYAVEWPWASELLPSVPLALTELVAADTIPIDRATISLRDRANTSAGLSSAAADRQI
jgi:hypothetical protein